MSDPSFQSNGTIETGIASPSESAQRLRGSGPSDPMMRGAALLRRPVPNGDPEPDGDGHHPPPPPPISAPDLALQTSTCLPSSLNGPIVSAVQQAIGASADVRTACINGTQRIGIWLRPAENTGDSQARDRGLSNLSILATGETVAFMVNAALIRRQAFDSWNAAPKRLNGDGNADPSGPIHLTGFSLDFMTPNQVIIRIDGFDERPWPDVTFRLTVTDTLSLSGGEVGCASNRNLDVDTSWLNFLAGLFLIVLPPLGAVFLVERIIIGSVNTPDIGAGAGCAAASQIPKEIYIPGGVKVVFSYSRLAVSQGGIFAGGNYVVIPRAPEVTVLGPSLISVVEGTASLSRTYSLNTDDLRPPLRIAWSGDVTPARSDAETTAFRFSLAGGQAGNVLTRRVAVRVTDADNLASTAELVVRIYFTSEDGELPPVCRVKPWLPQCQGVIRERVEEP